MTILGLAESFKTTNRPDSTWTEPTLTLIDGSFPGTPFGPVGGGQGYKQTMDMATLVFSSIFYDPLIQPPCAAPGGLIRI